MHIGEKIKELRMSKCITQSQLAGDFITRNMLSRIENGVALPSIPTILYISEKLKVSPGYLLAQDNEEYIYKKIYSMDNIKRAFSDGDYRICRDICRSIGQADDELNLILARCDIGIAKEEFFLGRLRSSVRFFEEALEYDAKTVYSRGINRAEAAIYLRYMRRLSPTLIYDDEVTGDKIVDEMASNDAMCEYMLALERMEYDDDIVPDNVILMYHINPKSPLAFHLKAKYELRNKNFSEAKKLLNQILNLQERIADPILYSVFFDLEICSREVGDFKDAYEYSVDKVNLLERMLAEVDTV